MEKLGASSIWRCSYNNPSRYFCNLRFIFRQVFDASVSSTGILTVIQTKMEDGEKDSISPPQSLFQTFPLIIMRKSGQRGAWINGKEVYRCWWKLPNKPREEGYVLVGLLSRLNILEGLTSDCRPTISFSVLSQTKEVDIIIIIIARVWVNKKCFKFWDCM